LPHNIRSRCLPALQHQAHGSDPPPAICGRRGSRCCAASPAFGIRTLALKATCRSGADRETARASGLNVLPGHEVHCTQRPAAWLDCVIVVRGLIGCIGRRLQWSSPRSNVSAANATLARRSQPNCTSQPPLSAASCGAWGSIGWQRWSLPSQCAVTSVNILVSSSTSTSRNSAGSTT
jgi:hypothetical protein